MPLTRRRLSSAESRSAALQAARDLLLQEGPQSVTLKAVADRIDRTHANVLHHFGSALGLQEALAEHLAKSVSESVRDAVNARRAGIGSPREVVEIAFDAFDREGGGALVSWILLTGNEESIEPIIDTIRDLVDEIHPSEGEAEGSRIMREATLSLILMALGNALMGRSFAKSLRVSQDVAFSRAEEMLTASCIKAGELPG